MNHRLENGRSYHVYKDGSKRADLSLHCNYLNSVSNQLTVHSDMQHHLFYLTLDGRLGLAPPCKPGAKVGRVLDLGTGTGIWAIDFGEEHPESEVLGIDLSPSQPEFVPSNVKFEIDDIEEDWLYSRPFDYIHSRLIQSGIADWKKYVTKAYDNLVPGGYLELQEADLTLKSDDDTLPSDSAMKKLGKLITEAADTFGRPFIDAPTIKQYLIEVGFEDVTLYCYKWPMNTWPKDSKYKELGNWHLINLLEALEAMAMAPLTRIHNWTREEVNVFLVDVRNEFKNRNIHAYHPVYSIVGRKPLKVDSPAPV
ncbi:UMTA [Colletotrichum truncatum]|uniref:UMTA n=1 Tax=Colletotrichum truncatum TaxID=5467 RepID=A0ACC3ZIW0_COLTU